jgi:hypothetical protein
LSPLKRDRNLAGQRLLRLADFGKLEAMLLEAISLIATL